MEASDIQLNHVYRAKKPKIVGLFTRNYDDRMVVYIGPKGVQYDSPTVKFGGKYKLVTFDNFLKWAGKDVTEQTPKGDWEEIPLQ